MPERKLANSRHLALAALAKFKIGDRVKYPERGWVGTVTNKSEDIPWIYCKFDDVGLAGCDPRRIVHASGTEAGTGETERLDPKGDGPVPKGDAQ